MEHYAKTQQEIEREMLELDKQFSEFLHTKGVAEKFKLAFGGTTGAQQKLYETDSADDDEGFAEFITKEWNAFLRSKGLDSQYTVVVMEKKE